MKLSGWYRIGIVLSVLWCFLIIVISILQYNYPTEHRYFVTLKSDTTKQIITTEELMKPHNHYIDIKDVVWDKPVINYGNIFLSMIVPIVVGWVLILMSIWTIKWVIRGFKFHPSKS